MSDDKTKRGKADRIRISVTQTYERQHWQKAFGVTKSSLLDAVRSVGPMVRDVKLYLIERIRAAK